MMILSSSLFSISNKKVEKLIATDQLNEAEKIIPSLKKFEQYYFTGLIENLKGNPEKAYFIMEKALKLKDDDPDILYKTAKFLLSTDNSKDANLPSGKEKVDKTFDFLKKGYKLNPKHKGLIFHLALEYQIVPWFYGGDDDETEKILSDTYKFDEEYSDLCKLRLFFFGGDMDDAGSFGEKCIEKYSLNPNFYFLTARSYFMRNMNDKGFEVLDRGISKIESTKLLSYYGNYSVKKKLNYDKGIEYLKRYLKLKDKINILDNQPRLFRANYLLGKLYHLKNDYENAKTYLKKSLELNPNYSKSKKLLIMIK